jgi:hypothetical protein
MGSQTTKQKLITKIKINTMTTDLFQMLKTDAEADKAKALLSLRLLGNDAVGIGDHSTGDFYKNAQEALNLLVDANDRLETLEEYFSKDLS